MSGRFGNPIEIGAVVVFQVRDTAQALFAVEDYRHYVDVQIETAIRRLASIHPYDDSDHRQDGITLRGDSEQVAAELERELDRFVAAFVGSMNFIERWPEPWALPSGERPGGPGLRPGRPGPPCDGRPAAGPGTG